MTWRNNQRLRGLSRLLETCAQIREPVPQSTFATSISEERLACARAVAAEQEGALELATLCGFVVPMIGEHNWLHVEGGGFYNAIV